VRQFNIILTILSYNLTICYLGLQKGLSFLTKPFVALAKSVRSIYLFFLSCGASSLRGEAELKVYYDKFYDNENAKVNNTLKNLCPELHDYYEKYYASLNNPVNNSLENSIASS